MKNIVFDLGGVVFSRNYKQCSPDMAILWEAILSESTPTFWLDFDRGILTWEATIEAIAKQTNLSTTRSREILQEALDITQAVPQTCQLINDLKQNNYKLFVLSNMSKYFIDTLHKHPIFKLFDGEIISCYYNLVKPEPEIYQLLLNKFQLQPTETLFIDDKPENTKAAEAFGISTILFDRQHPEISCKQIHQFLLNHKL